MKQYSTTMKQKKQSTQAAKLFIRVYRCTCHFISYGQSLFSVDLYDSKSFDEVLERVKKFAAEHPNETWIRGRGWDQNKFPGKSFPTNDSLNKYFPDKPFYSNAWMAMHM
jgi:hypothetical protein